MNRVYVDIDVFDALVNEGWLRKEHHPYLPMMIYNYTNRTQFAQHWTPETMMARGLIVRWDGKVLARPFKKFFNYGEKMPIQSALIVEATTKLDGSLGILYWDEDKPLISTRGSFVSDQAIWASEWIQNKGLRHANFENLTLLFEIIYPENRVVVDYGDMRELALIGAIEIDNGRDLLHDELRPIATRYGFAQPLTYPMNDINEYLRAAAALSANVEGWVIRYSDGSRFKVKGDAYRLAHKLLTGISFKRVLEAVANGTLNQWLEDVPDEFLTTIRSYETEIKEMVESILERTKTLYECGPHDNRKDFAIWANKHWPQDAPYLFAYKDHKPLEPIIYKNAFKDRNG